MNDMLLERRESHKRRKNFYQKIFGKEDQVSNIILLIPSVGTLNKYAQAIGRHLEFHLSEHTE